MTRTLFHLAAAFTLLAAGCRKKNAEPPIAPVSQAISPGATPLEAEQAVVTASRGKVELLRGSSGSWAEAKVGDRLSVKDALRTDLGEADVAVDGVKVRLHEASRLELTRIDKRTMRTRVHGSVESEVERARSGRCIVELPQPTGQGADQRAWRAVVTYLLRRPEFLYE